MKAIIWGSCGSLPSPLSSAEVRSKLVAAIWESRHRTFQNKHEIETYLDTLPHSASGTYKANTSCVQIVTGSEAVILCDAGSGIRDYAHSLDPETAPKSYHIFVSHLHWDHIQGFPFFTPAYKAGNRITFHGFHPEIETAIRQQMEAPCFPVPFSAMQAEINFDIREEGASFDVDGVHVQTIKQQHPGDAWGYCFTEAGKRIVYSSDSEHGPESSAKDYPFIDFFQSADILIFDGQYTSEEAANEKRNWGHSDHKTAVELASRAKVKKLVVFHHEPSYSDAMIEAIHHEALDYRETFNRKHFPAEENVFPFELLLAYDGLCIET